MHAQQPPPPPNGVVPPHVHNYGHDARNFQEYISRPNSPLNRNAFVPNQFDRTQEEDRYFEGERTDFRNGAHQYRGREPEQDGIGKIKVKITSFEGKCDSDVYMVWETKIEQIWSCHNFPENKKV